MRLNQYPTEGSGAMRRLLLHWLVAIATVLALGIPMAVVAKQAEVDPPRIEVNFTPGDGGLVEIILPPDGAAMISCSGETAPDSMFYEDVGIVAVECVAFTPTPTQTPVPTDTPTLVPTATATPTITPTPTKTPRPPTRTPVATRTPTVTKTPAASATAVATSTPTATDTAVPTPTATATDTTVPTSTATATATPEPTPTDEPTPTPEPTLAPTDTALPTSTATVTPPPGATATRTPTMYIPPTDTPTPLPTPSSPLGSGGVTAHYPAVVEADSATHSVHVAIQVAGDENNDAVADVQYNFNTSGPFDYTPYPPVTLARVDATHFEGNVDVTCTEACAYQYITVLMVVYDADGFAWESQPQIWSGSSEVGMFQTVQFRPIGEPIATPVPLATPVGTPTPLPTMSPSGVVLSNLSAEPDLTGKSITVHVDSVGDDNGDASVTVGAKLNIGGMSWFGTIPMERTEGGWDAVLHLPCDDYQALGCRTRSFNVRVTAHDPDGVGLSGDLSRFPPAPDMGNPEREGYRGTQATAYTLVTFPDSP